MFLLHETHRLVQEFQDLEPLGGRDGVGIQLIELCEETDVGWADVDEGRDCSHFAQPEESLKSERRPA